MGMFDTIYVNNKLLPVINELLKNNYSLSALQTKDFECSLLEYHVDENGTLTLDDVEYIFTENKESSKKGKWRPPFFQEEKSRKRVFVPYTGIVIAGAFFMNYIDYKDEIFVDIEFKFVDGVLQGIGKIHNMTITPASEVLERRKIQEERKIKRDNDFICQVSLKLSSYISKVISILKRVQYWLYSHCPK